MAHNHVYAICENKCMVETKTKAQIDSDIESGTLHHKKFTYVVNSKASLQYWLTNKASGTSSGGNDFTSVLIKKGSWTFTGNTTALDTIGTLCIEGEAGSEIKINLDSGALNALWFRIGNKNSSMNNVKLTVNSDASQSSGFYNCYNLTNCYCKIDDDYTYPYMGGNAQSMAFRSCKNLINCVGVGLASVNGTAIGLGFSNCRMLMNCEGAGDAYNTNIGNGYGFYGCHNVNNCKAESHCKTDVFSDCYASWEDNSTYACADTADGGFNDTTNPDA